MIKVRFNGELLEKKLDACVPAGSAANLVLAMMFISPGRHAGPGGDIEAICAEAQTRHPGLQLAISPLIGEHPLLIDILKADAVEAEALTGEPDIRSARSRICTASPHRPHSNPKATAPCPMYAP